MLSQECKQYQEKAQQYFLAGQFQQAEEYVLKALALSPDEWDLLRLASNISIQSLQYEKIYNYCKRFDRSKEIEENIFIALENIRNLDLIDSLDALEKDLVLYKSQDQVDGKKVRLLTQTLVICRLRKLQQQGFTLQDIAQEELLQHSLAYEIPFNCELEVFVTDIRKALLLSSLEQQNVPQSLISLLAVIAIQCYLNEYIFLVSEEEQELVDGLKIMLRQQLAVSSWQPREVSSLLLLIAMYQALIELEQSADLQKVAIKQWPQCIQEVMTKTLFDLLEIRQIATDIEALSSIENSVSLKVQQQYEENPFPRWTRLCYFQDPMTYLQGIEHLKQNISPPAYFSQPELNILVAGCGTGYQALALAKSCQNAEVLAIDISCASLAYGQRMARVYGIENVEFKQADILQLTKINRRFHIIECTGVLHHMDDPRLGLSILSKLLEPEGLLHLGLYSYLARSPLNMLREISARINFRPTVENIRAFRQNILMGDAKEEHMILRGYMDFYYTSGCRDLLFHCREHQLNLMQVKHMLMECRLRFLGFELQKDVQEHYLSMFPQDTSLTNLDNWHLFEKKYPHTFTAMYQFHCQII